MSTTCTSPTPRVFGPVAPSLLTLRGIRFWSDEHGAGGDGAGAGGDGGQGGGDGGQGGGGNSGGQGGSSSSGGNDGGQGGRSRKPDDAPVTMADLRAQRAEAANYRRERDELAQKHQTAESELSELRSWKTQREQGDAIRAGAGDKGNASLLIDSGKFRASAEKAKLDFGDADAVKAFVSKFVDDNPEYGQTAGLPGSGGPARHGGGSDPSLEQQLEQAEKDHRTEDVIGLKRAIAAKKRGA